MQLYFSWLYYSSECRMSGVCKSIKTHFYFSCEIKVRLDIDNIDLIETDENVKMSKRKLIPYKNVVEKFKNLEDQHD